MADEDHEFRKLEYEALNRELLDHSSKIYQVVVLCSGGVAGILSYTLTADINKFPLGASFFPFVLLVLPVFVLLPGVLLVTSSLRVTGRIAGYIRVFYEKGKDGLTWQTAMQLYRKDSVGKKHRSFKRALMWDFGGLSCGSLFCALCAAWRVHSLNSAPKPFNVLFTVLFVFVALTYIYLITRIDRAWSTKAIDTHKQVFERVKAKLLSDSNRTGT